MLDAINIGVLIGAGLIAASIMSSLISSRVGVPLLLVFLAVGLLAGVDGPGGIQFQNASMAYVIGSIALAIILFESGFETPFHSFKVAAWPALTLATFGVLLTTVIVGAVATYLLPFSRIEGLLMGAIVSSTDAAAVFFLMRAGGVIIRDRVRSTLEIESGSNDPMAILLTLMLVQVAAGVLGVEHPTREIVELLIRQLGLGLLLGALGGWGIVELVNRLRLDPGLYPIVVISLGLMLFAITGLVGGSGFLAIYLAGIVVGNLNLRAANAVRKFIGGLTWLCQITMFLTLGLLANPSNFGSVLGAALGLAATLIFVARPLTVWLMLKPFGFSRDETGFVAWVGLRGAVSILLATLPILYGLPHASMFFNIAFIIVLTSLLIQGWTIAPVARWLGLILPSRLGPLERVQLDLPGNADNELVVYRITPDSPVAKGAKLPRWARPSLILRNGKVVSEATSGGLSKGDYVYLFTSPKQVPLLDKLFASPRGTDDSDFFGNFTIEPGILLTEIAATYDFPIPEQQKAFTVEALFDQAFNGRYEVGDRLPIGEMELVLRSLDDQHRITEVGLVLEPSGLIEEKLKLRPTLRRMGRKIAGSIRKPKG